MSHQMVLETGTLKFTSQFIFKEHVFWLIAMAIIYVLNMAVFTLQQS